MMKNKKKRLPELCLIIPLVLSSPGYGASIALEQRNGVSFNMYLSSPMDFALGYRFFCDTLVCNISNGQIDLGGGWKIDGIAQSYINYTHYNAVNLKTYPASSKATYLSPCFFGGSACIATNIWIEAVNTNILSSLSTRTNPVLTYNWVAPDGSAATIRPTTSLYLVEKWNDHRYQLYTPAGTGDVLPPPPVRKTSCQVDTATVLLSLPGMAVSVPFGVTGSKPVNISCNESTEATVVLQGCTLWDSAGLCHVSMSRGATGMLKIHDSTNGTWKKNTSVSLARGTSVANIEYDFSKSTATSPGSLSASVVATITYQ